METKRYFREDAVKFSEKVNEKLCARVLCDKFICCVLDFSSDHLILIVERLLLPLPEFIERTRGTMFRWKKIERRCMWSYVVSWRPGNNVLLINVQIIPRK